ncbi:amino acid permease [Falsibacillus albus]|uniref:Amino acid permease n=1 Tax=Falsibacillus albus TaxID=2478915 RepID=A0A3L7JRK1_9BACI|nr:amino acid permease [Falsibacillus albus]RLQ93433.1 amino acid permease [Falsibacillus albus]
MKPHHPVKQHVKHTQQQKMKKGKDGALNWWNLSLIGIGSVIGAGFFLGTGLSIHTAGPAVLIGYLFGGITSYLVFMALSEMTVHDPQPGSFRTYAKKAFGPLFGFMSGWMYWVAGLLIMSSEITALSIFTQFWFPHVPLWVFSIIYSLLGIGIILLGASNFGRIESMFGVIKLSTLVIFILFGLAVLLGLIPKSLSIHSAASTASIIPFFANGWLGLWASLIFVLFSFGGIAVMGVAATELKNKSDITKAGNMMLLVLLAIYVSSIFLAMKLVNWKDINESESPFVTALTSFRIPYLDSIFNIIIISAAFSTMVGALFSITNVLVSLAEDGDAPSKFTARNQKGVPLASLLLSAAGLAALILVSYFLPHQVYEYLVTSAGVMLILNWVMILSSQIKNRTHYENKASFLMFGYPFTSYLGIAMIVLTISGGLLHKNQRIGLLISVMMVAIIFAGYGVKHLYSSHQKTSRS